MLKKLVISGMSALLLWGCTTSPLGRSQLAFMPADQMDAMGVEAFNAIKKETRIESSSKINGYVGCIADSIVSVNNTGVPQWEVVVFREEDANAFALPGGKIGVYTGLLDIADNQDRLATVIGHEIAHVLANHSNERMSQQTFAEMGMGLLEAAAIINTQTEKGQMIMAVLGLGTQFGVLLPYGRKQESEADVLGLQLMATAGFDPRESINLWQNMNRTGDAQPPEFLSTHPSHETRINDLARGMEYALGLQKQAHTSGQQPRCRL